MLRKIDPTTTRSWKRLAGHYQEMKTAHMKSLFAADPERFTKFSLRFNDILVDYSKNIITGETRALLLGLADEVRLREAIEKIFTGDMINETENRAVLHVALRNRNNTPIVVDGEDVMPKVNAVLNRMKAFSHSLISGAWKGFSGKRITDIVNIGIGGSDLGPMMVTECLRPYAHNDLSVHFVSNVDGTHIVETLKKLNPETGNAKKAESGDHPLPHCLQDLHHPGNHDQCLFRTGVVFGQGKGCQPCRTPFWRHFHQP
jgi:glucose-6-phosphate isomerase